MEKTIKSLLKIAKSCLQVNKSSGTKRLPNILKYECPAPFSPVKHLNFASIVFGLNVKFTYHHFPAKSFEFRAIFRIQTKGRKRIYRSSRACRHAQVVAPFRRIRIRRIR